MKTLFNLLLIFLLATLNFKAWADEDQKINCSITNNIPIHFIENKGQLDKSVHYYVKGLNKSIYFKKDYLEIRLSNNDELNKHKPPIKLHFVDSNHDATLIARIKNPTIYSFFYRGRDDWKTNISSYRNVIYHDLWPGIDLVFTGNINLIKYKFIVKPGADPKKIQMAYAGVDNAVINSEDELIVFVGSVELLDTKPIAYQMEEVNKTEVGIGYSMISSCNSSTEYKYCFDIDIYDSSKILVIDPAILLFCGYIGGTDFDQFGAMVIDDYGNIYITGSTTTEELYNRGRKQGEVPSSGWNIYIAKINATGTYLEYCVYIIGDKWSDISSGIDVDGDGCAYVIGVTESTENDGFPVQGGPDLTFNGGSYDGFVAKINSMGSELVYCGYIGGSKDDFISESGDISVDEYGYVYIAGDTFSNESSLPIQNGPDLTYNGSGDVIVAKLDPSGLYYEYFGYIGGVEYDEANCITIDGLGNSYVAGFTYSDRSTFPVKKGPDLTFNGYVDGFIAKINNTGSGIEFCGYIGGDDRDICNDVALDHLSNVYVSGFTRSTEITFPVINGPELIIHKDHQDGFIAKISSSGSHFQYCGYIGGDDYDSAIGVEVDNRGYAYVVGNTASDESSLNAINFPDITYNGGSDVFVGRVVPSGDKLDFLGYLGGSKSDSACDLAIDDLTNIYVFGYTCSDESTFPVQIGPDLILNEGLSFPYDNFIAKYIQIGLTCNAYYISSYDGSVDYYIDAGKGNAYRDYILLGSLNSVNPGTYLPGNTYVLPFVLDSFTRVILFLLNKPICQGFYGKLDKNGKARARLTFIEVRPELIGLKMFFACCLINPYDFVSNPVAIEIVD